MADSQTNPAAAQGNDQPQGKVSYQDFITTVKGASPTFAGMDDHEVAEKVFERRPELRDRIDWGSYHQGQGGQGAGGSWDKPANPFLAGMNPLHQAGSAMADPSKMKDLGTVKNTIADSQNAREISGLAGEGRYGAAAAMGAGTVAGDLIGDKVFGWAGGKLMDTAAGKATSETFRKAANWAKELKLSNRGMPEFFPARATQYLQPLRDALDKQYQVMHTALQGKPIMTNPRMGQLTKLLEHHEGESGVKPILQDMRRWMNNQAIDYDNARKTSQNLGNLLNGEKAHNLADNTKQYLQELKKELDEGLDTLAQSQGMGDFNKRLSVQWRQLQNLAVSIGTSSKQAPSTSRKAAGAIVGGLGGGTLGLITPAAGGVGAGIGSLEGMRMMSGTANVLKPELEQEAVKLGKQLGVKNLPKGMFTNDLSGKKVAGAALKGTGKAIKYGAGRAVQPAMSGSQAVPSQ